jgi:curli production assembly/transport component CsgF
MRRFQIRVWGRAEREAVVGFIFQTGKPTGGPKRRVPAIFVGVLGILVASTGVCAQDLSYKPINPTFGGNPFNSQHLLGVANAQNDYKDPRSTANSSQSDAFARQLQSRLLSAVSSQIVDAIFGENPQERGTISLGGQTIEFVRDLENVTITITTDATGEVTKLVVPLFVNLF